MAVFVIYVGNNRELGNEIIEMHIFHIYVPTGKGCSAERWLDTFWQLSPAKVRERIKSYIWWEQETREKKGQSAKPYRKYKKSMNLS